MDGWVDVGASTQVEASSHLGAEVDGYLVRVVRVAGTLYAFEDRCTHDDSPFDDAELDDCEIICPRHGARFSLRDGAALSPPAYEPLRIFQVREKDGRIEVRA
ncbi:MAG TPA: non-heme iron oxygenase ferredoxin subunit [Steroidobacteraceae bacterium]|nr:non-heme iron oxygenase ferredoxin subunit [Steroidobacteraceae bacterium]